MNKERAGMEIERTVPTRFRLFTTYVFDFLCLAIIALLLSFAFTPLSRMTPIASEAINKRDEILLTSNLYEKNGDVISNIAETTDKMNLTMNDKSSRIDAALNKFFGEWLGSKEDVYGKYKASSKAKDGSNMFADGIRALSNADYDVEYLSFYKDVALNKAPAYLTTNQDYLASRRTLIIVETFAIGIAASVSYIIFYVAIPLIFHRGKQTIGMKLNGIYSLTSDGISVTWGRYLLFALVRYLLMGLLAIPLLLVPYFVSVTMLIVRDERQILCEYLFGMYRVTAKKDEIYESSEELLKKEMQ